MRRCRACGTENPDDARFCLHCGVALAEQCPNCGADLPGEVRFCPSCGAAIAERIQAGEERKLVTLLFADVTGSTSLGEHLDPEQFREVMSGFFTAMRREIEAEGGTVEKFIGDAVMAAFGVPVAHEDDPSRALRAGLRMRDALARLNDRFQREHGLSLAMRIGVNTGEVVAQTAPTPGEGMVSGDATNVAARLEQLAEPGQILVSARTARGARGFEFRPRGPLALRGKADPVRAFELIGEGCPAMSDPARRLHHQDGGMRWQAVEKARPLLRTGGVDAQPSQH